MKKIQYVKLVGLLTIYYSSTYHVKMMTLYCEVVELQNKAGLLTKHILPQQSKPSLLLSRPCLAGLLKTVPLHYCHWTIQQVIQGKIP